jgi:hypothetical protein
MTTDVPGDEQFSIASKPVTIPILVGVVGKRKSRLVDLGVPDDEVRRKLEAAFNFLETLTPSSPKLLLCGMADGVDEIGAKLIIGAGDSTRTYGNWSVVGLLPLPPEVFVDDFAGSGHQGWWYDGLDDKQKRLIRLMPLQTLSKSGATAPGVSPSHCVASELRSDSAQSNAQRNAHYEQLALILAERATVFIAVMPENETPGLPGGSAQAVAHRLNGWRADWPPPNSVAVAEASREFVMPPPLAKSTSGDVWLVSVGSGDSKAPHSAFRVLHRREETEPLWPQPLENMPHRRGLIAKLRGRRPSSRQDRATVTARDIPVGFSAPFTRFVSRSGAGRVARAIEAFNRRSSQSELRKPPPWDKTIEANPADPAKWSPVAVADQIRGTLSDLQVIHKQKIRKAAWALGVLAWVSIACLEIGLEFNKAPITPAAASTWYDYLVAMVPLAYVLTVGASIFLLETARRHAWAPLTEDYRMVAEALRVQMAWWQFGMIERRDWVDQHILRYDAREFQLIRQGLAAILESLRCRNAPLEPVKTSESLPDGVGHWIGTGSPNISGQLGYQNRTARLRKRSYESYEFTVWMFFGAALGMAIWLTLFAWHEAFRMRILDAIVSLPAARVLAWLAPGLLVAMAVLFALFIAREHFEGATEGVTFRRVLHSLIPGMLFSAGIVLAVYYWHWNPHALHALLGAGTLLFLAAAGAIKYVAEKVDVEAEAQGSAEAYIIYARARRVLDEIGRDLHNKAIDLTEAGLRRERVIRDLGLYALTETEAWLKSHRERPLHPPVGS